MDFNYCVFLIVKFGLLLGLLGSSIAFVISYLVKNILVTFTKITK